MKKLLSVLFVFVMVFALATTVRAKDNITTCSALLDNTIEYARQHGLNGATPVTSGGNNYGVNYMNENIMFTCENLVVSYTKGSSDKGFTVLQYLVGYVAENNSKTDVLSYDDFSTKIFTVLPIANNKTCEQGFSGTLTDDGEDIQSFKIDAKNFGTNTCSSGSGSSSSNTSNKTTETNPKTGVFVPVVGISVLIVASVVCLLWISKKNIYKGL